MLDASERRQERTDSAREFFRILTHDDRNSNYIVATKSGSGWAERAMKAGELSGCEFDDVSAYYVTRNGFNGKKREANRCRQVNAIMFDVDCHDGNHRSVLPELTECVYDAVFGAVLPHPNLLVNTGRGLQIYYVLDHSTPVRVRGGKHNEKGLGFFRDVEKGLAARLEDVIAGIEGADLDSSVYDFSRVSRIPGTFNPKAGSFSELLISSDDYYTLVDLKRYCTKKERRRTGAKPRKIERQNGSRMLEARMRMVENLQERRGFNCEGSRENMCFVYYNSACQVFDRDEALDLTLKFNSSFLRPLPESDIRCIKRTVDNVVVAYGPHKGDTGYYPLKAATVVEKLFMTAEEVSALGVFSPSRKLQREEKKRQTRERRERRDNRICELYKKGYKQKQIANKVKCSLRTVTTVISREGVKRGNLMDTVRAEYEIALADKAARDAERAKRGANSPLTCENARIESENAKRCQTSWVVLDSNQSENDSGEIESPPMRE